MVIEMDQQAEKYEKIQNIVELANKSEISSIRNIVSGIIRVIDNPKSTAKDLKDMVQVDPPLTGRMLRLANSAYYPPQKKISDIQQAIIWVGYEAVKELALSQKVCEIFNKDKFIEGYSRKALWKHSLAVALLGKMIYRREFGERGENIYVAGLLHDIGLIAEDQFCQDEFRLTLSKSKNELKNITQVEYEVLGYDHADLGQALVDSWNLPQELVIAIGNHHNPGEIAEEFSKITSTLYVADSFCQEKDMGYRHGQFENKAVFNKCLGKLNLEHRALDLIIEDVEYEISRMKDQGFLK
jgi:putative nucleotidyltransferase with HDIG domain